MKLRDILLLVFLAAIWGFNFVPIRIGLDQMPPMTFTLMRLLFTTFPAIFFIKKPKIPLWKVAAYGTAMFAFQFGLVFSGIHAGMSAGLASLVMQIQAFFTIGLAALLLRERPLLFQVIGAVVATGGVAIVGLHVGGDVTVLGLGLVVTAAFCWSCGNLITKSFGKTDMFSVIVWGNLFASVLLIIAAVATDGVAMMQQSILGLHVLTLVALAYIAYVSTFIGYSIWSHMLAHYPAAMVVPFTLLVPAFAMLSASVFLGESYPLWKFEATILILCGLALNQFGGKAAGKLGRLLKPSPEAAPD
jgi:O-acetylserine/cysteine efflux transporter